jgi:YebC/PmpR family DNA-binding regulatory protein
MSGHSKWAQIKRKKAKNDQQRGKLFSKLIREITTAARVGGGDPKGNMRLKAAIEEAKAVNMPADTLKRAIQKGTGELPGETYEEVTYEGYGPAGVALMVKVLTDNKNRTAPEIRHAFTKFGGNLGTDGSVAYLFKRIGVLSYAGGADEEKITDAAIEAGDDDVKVWPEDGQIDVITTPDSFEAVRETMEKAGLKPDHAEVTMRAELDVPVAADQVEAVQGLLARLDELDDVQAVHSNADLPAG